ncbi:MAG: plasmid mobilization relaxosome protein MobC [Methylococcaceae bacterium]|nr:plasmid mobilization relaxosome protein MobC [Methylococcaceae bacterium]
MLELDKLDERLYQVRMIGHNLNQVARALNSHELHPSQIELMPTLQLLMQNLDAEKQALRTIFNHNLKRW